MTGTNKKLTGAVETYFADLARTFASGGATGERSSYGPLHGLLSAAGATLRPKVFCVGELADQGAGHPDFGLYSTHQVQRGKPREGQMPERGVVEVKSVDDDAWLTAAGDQVSRYWGRYRLVLVTNMRDFVLVGEDAAGRPAKLETFRAADSAGECLTKLERPRAFAGLVGAGLGEYFARALSHRTALAEPKDLAWLLASYARDGLARVEAAGDGETLATVRTSLEDALGVRFEGERGTRFSLSTLVQTLFYGVFAAWVLWARGQRSDAGPLFDGEPSSSRFDWRTAVWHLRAPVLVIVGNPPYNGFAGMAVDEERELSQAYRTTRRVRRPKGQGLNDLYVRFCRMAERRIAEKTGQGIVCFISNYSWLDGLSFTGMRERFLEAFDEVRVDCLNGDKYLTGKVAADGAPDPSVFSTAGDPVGIQVGTAIATLVRKAEHAPAVSVGFRHLWGQAKRIELLETAEAKPHALYETVDPVLPLGLPFVQTAVSEEWFGWPSLPDLFPVSFPGVKTSRDRFLVDADLDRLRTRIVDYFVAGLNHNDIARRYPGVMKSTKCYDARTTRDALLARGGPDEDGFMRLAYRPFDDRWLYWEKDTKLLDEKRAEYRPHVFEGNMWLSSAQHLRKGADEAQACVSGQIGCLHLIERSALMFPIWLSDDGMGSHDGGDRRPNLTAAAQRYLDRLGLGVEELFHHALATLHKVAYREANADALRMDWPRIPLPGWPDAKVEGAAEALGRSAASGRNLATLLDMESPVEGVTRAPFRPEIAAIAVPETVDGRNMAGNDFAVTAGWGRWQGDAVMPEEGRAFERPYSPDEGVDMGDTTQCLGESTYSVWLNARAYWSNVPTEVWNYRLGGYQVLKKWHSYRELDVLGRPLLDDEVQHCTETARRIAAILSFTRAVPSPPRHPVREAD